MLNIFHLESIKAEDLNDLSNKMINEYKKQKKYIKGLLVVPDEELQQINVSLSNETVLYTIHYDDTNDVYTLKCYSHIQVKNCKKCFLVAPNKALYK